MHCPLVFLIFILLVFLFFILLVFLLFNRTSPLHPTPLSGLHFHPSIHPWHLYLDPSGRFDDTNPEAEKREYIDHLQDIYRTLSSGWAGSLSRTSVDFVLSLLLAAQGNQGVQIK
ncbi:uncharacterized protein LOC120273814 isoform X6 [Dioscorea cayenensis subsp. rotundata]|uniref:Uncharacterized protein LOC120273814 isoform X6 n=1 Tax=Dioscorea cayennensis subsp. rotundata TaxID=55577 RepID=A0AB40C9B6_DIOCR|nr:uncharacterized protein LOC120273814 isoform X6 [Dioscorea cayenensis subsp. rotundata]